MNYLTQILKASTEAQKSNSPVTLKIDGNNFITIKYEGRTETWGKFYYNGLVNQTFKEDGSPRFTNVHHIGVTLQVVKSHSTCDGKATTIHNNYEIRLEGNLTKSFSEFLKNLSYELEMTS